VKKRRKRTLLDGLVGPLAAVLLAPSSLLAPIRSGRVLPAPGTTKPGDQAILQCFPYSWHDARLLSDQSNSLEYSVPEAPEAQLTVTKSLQGTRSPIFHPRSLRIMQSHSFHLCKASSCFTRSMSPPREVARQGIHALGGTSHLPPYWRYSASPAHVVGCRLRTIRKSPQCGLLLRPHDAITCSSIFD